MFASCRERWRAAFLEVGTKICPVVRPGLCPQKVIRKPLRRHARLRILLCLDFRTIALRQPGHPAPCADPRAFSKLA